MVDLVYLIEFVGLELQPLLGEQPGDLVYLFFIVAVIEHPGFHQILRGPGFDQRQRLLVELMPVGPFDQIDEADVAVTR